MSKKEVYESFDSNAPRLCTWKPNTTEKSVHTKRPMNEIRKIYPSILEAIGCTPLVRLNKIPQSAGIKCEMYAKCEFMNPGGSVKDRIGLRMVQDAEESGRIKPGVHTLIEPTAGNTGIGLALVSALRGYRCIIVMPDHMSMEKEYVLRALNAEVVRCPKAVPIDDPRSVIGVAQRLQREIPNAVVLDQLRNPSNSLAHYDGTAAEILWQLDHKIDMIVCGAATSGTVSGIARRMKEEVPSCKVFAADPIGSKLARPESLNSKDPIPYEVEGMGFPLQSIITDYDYIDEWYKVADKETFPMCRRLVLEEGLLIGGSSGAAMSVALKVAKDLKEGQRCVVLLADGIRNYMTKFVSDNWMEAHRFKSIENVHKHWWWNSSIKDLNLPAAVSVKSNATFGEAIAALKTNNLTQLGVISAEDGSVYGAVTQDGLINWIVTRNKQLSDEITPAVEAHVTRIPSTEIVGFMARVLEAEPCVLIVDKTTDNKDVLRHVATKMDFLSFISNKN